MLGVAFEGCACRAAFHAGVAAELRALPIGKTAGASSGSLIAAGLAAGADLPSLWRALAGRSLVSLERARWNRSPFDMSHLVRTTLERVLAPVDLRRAPVEALVAATRLRDLSTVIYSSYEEPSLVEPLLGSCFLPVLYGRPIRVRGDWLVDGGVSDNLPLGALVARGCDEIIAVVTAPDGTALKRPLRPRWRPTAPGARVHVIAPRRPLRIRSWDLSRDRVEEALDEGRDAARAFLRRYATDDSGQTAYSSTTRRRSEARNGFGR